MPEAINQTTAQQIVDTVRDVCGYHINYIRPDGTIFASTDTARIGEFHEAGAKAAELGQTIEVTDDRSYHGAVKGVNMPFRFHGETIAVIGITGEPDEVRKYAYLAQRMVRLILREKEMDERNESRKSENSFIIHSLINRNHINHDFLTGFLNERGIDINEEGRILLLNLHHRKQSDSYTIIENRLETTLSAIPCSFYTFMYPNQYILAIADQEFEKQKDMLKRTAGGSEGVLEIAVGSLQKIEHLERSYSDASIARRSSHDPFVSFDTIGVEFLLTDISPHIRNMYFERTIDRLNDREKQILETYFENDMALGETADALYIHKNTLQYQLKLIAGKCGLDPRTFRSAAALYFSLLLKKY